MPNCQVSTLHWDPSSQFGSLYDISMNPFQIPNSSLSKLTASQIIYSISINLFIICCHLFEKGIMTEQFDTKRSRFIMGRNSLSSHNHALKNLMQNMLYKVAKIDFWQAITPLWPPLKAKEDRMIHPIFPTIFLYERKCPLPWVHFSAKVNVKKD